MSKQFISQTLKDAIGPDLITNESCTHLTKIVLKAIKQQLQNDSQFNLPGIGTLIVKARKGRSGRNPRTGESIEIPPRNTIRFKPSSRILSEINDDAVQPDSRNREPIQ